MYTLAQSSLIRGSAGDPIKTPWAALEQKGIVFRRGQLCLICAGPGTGKSALVLAEAIESGLPTVMFSADSDAFTQLSRAISMVCDLPMSVSEEMAREKELPEDIVEQLSGISLRIDYDAAPTIDLMEEIVEAHWELHGEYPAIIVVDNIRNVRMDIQATSDNQFAGLEGLMEYLHGMARETGAWIAALHHVNADHNNGNQPIPLNGVKGQITGIPEVVLTLFKKPLDEDTHILCVSAVKNRGGKYDSTGQTYAELEFNGSLMHISDVSGPEVSENDWDEHRREFEEMMLT